jgi:NAD(P)-dependent dehydrogenase (short-subunit alcohol dehydrogenase family)
MPVAVVTGASRGLGLALARALAERDWDLVVDARGADALTRAAASLGHAGGGTVRPVAGDVADPTHRRQLVDAATALGGLDLLVNNASVLGPSPQPELAEYPLDVLERVYVVNVLAPLALVQLALPLLEEGTGGRVVNVTSDAAVEGYEGWGGYGSSKAALEQWSAVLAAEKPALRVWWVDPGDMRTQMHQEAFPGEDISDRPLPEASVGGLLRLLDDDLPSGRYRTAELAPATTTAAGTAATEAGA